MASVNVLQENTFRTALPDPVFRPVRAVSLPVPIGAQPVTNTQVGAMAAKGSAASAAFSDKGNLLFKNITQSTSGAGSGTMNTVLRTAPLQTKGNPVLLIYSYVGIAGGSVQNVAFFRDDLQISPTYSIHATSGSVTITACQVFLDAGASSGSHTYQVRSNASGSGDSFQVIELG